MSNDGTVAVVGRHLALALRPLAAALASDQDFQNLANRLGFNVTSIPPNSGYDALRTATSDIVQALDTAPLDVSKLLDALIALEKALSNGLKAPDASVDDDFGKRLLEILVIDYLGVALPTVFRVFRAIRLITITSKPATATRPDYLEARLDYDAIPRVLSSPTDIVKGFFAWGTSQFTFWRIADWLVEFLNARGVRAHLQEVDPDVADAYLGDQRLDTDRVTLVAAFMDTIAEGVPVEIGFTMSNFPGADPGFIFQPLLPEKASFDLGGDLTLDAETNVSDAFGMLVSANGLTFKYPFAPATTTIPTASVALTFSPTDPRILIGDAGASRLEIKGAKTTVTIEMRSQGLDVSAEAATVGLQLVIAGGDGDGFIATLLGGKTITIPLDTGVRWSIQSGISFSGSGKFEVTLEPNLTLGPVRVSTLTLGLAGKPKTTSTPTTLAVTVGAGIGADLGPVHASLDKVGVELDLEVRAGTIGPFDLGVGFKPPNGVGIAVNGGAISGGGFLSFDFDAGRYSGAIELEAYSLSIKAFGLIETKVPGGGFSFVIVISTEFATPIQLGLGFTLNGVGGLIGINRTVDSDALRALVVAGRTENLLFPKNVIANAPAIIRDLGTVFPARAGHYVFGPLAKLGWGTPTLITAELALILELPGPVLSIIGEVKCLLPKPELALVKFNMSIAGQLDFPHKSFSLDAALHDSVIDGFPVSGQMAMRLRWGEQPNFALSIGGFHPAYQPPPNFPTLQPMTVALAQQSSTSVTVSGFFALTSNTLQIGGEARLHAGGSGISLDASIAVKTIFIFSPFSFAANVDASVKISFHGYGPSVHLSGVLSGPSPWRAKGEVCVSILWWDACLRFDQTFGGTTTTPEPVLDPWLGSDTVQGLQAALQEPKNWAALPPPGSFTVVSRAPGADDLVDPLGGFTVRQKAVPVETTLPIARFGPAKAAEPAANRTGPIFFKGGAGSYGASLALTKLDTLKDFFAPAQFFDMNEAKKLSAKSFDKYGSGYSFSIKPANIEAGSIGSKAVQYTTLILGSGGTVTQPTLYDLPPAHLAAKSSTSAVARGGFAQSATRRYVDPTFTQPFTVNDVGFTLANTDSLQAVDPSTAPLPRADALVALDNYIALHPEQRGTIQVVPTHELAAA